MDANTKSKRKIYLASHNRHKLEELRALLKDLAVEIHLVSELGKDITWDETGKTFDDNARIKARAVKAYTSDCVLADDSGLEVSALSGAPGVFSARYAGPSATDAKNNQKLIEELRDAEDTTAHFTCCLCFIDYDGAEYIFWGQLDGEIQMTPSGSNGFGYDPLFYLPDRKETLAQLSPEEKNRISHRQAAVTKFRQFLS